MKRFLALCIALSLFATFGGRQKVKKEDLTPVVVTVCEGDTAWGIARKYCPDGVDIREYLTWVEEESGADFNKKIHPGQKLVFLKEVEEG